jgi:hypothetical protein
MDEAERAVVRARLARKAATSIQLQQVQFLAEHLIGRALDGKCKIGRDTRGWHIAGPALCNPIESPAPLTNLPDRGVYNDLCGFGMLHSARRQIACNTHSSRCKTRINGSASTEDREERQHE